MTKRERMLLWAVIASAVLAGGNYAVQRARESFGKREQRIEDLEMELARTRRRIVRGVLAARTIGVYEQRSLPSQPHLANSRYRDWLHHWLLKADVTDHQVTFQSAQRVPDTYDKYTFTIACRVDLEQWVQLLYDFYHVDQLHRIKTMSVQPLEDGRLSLGLTIEALSLPGAAKDRELGQSVSKRLAYENLQSYLDRIVGRNPYAPANEPPRFAMDSEQEAFVGRPVSLQIEADDPEGGRVRYRLVGELPGEYRLDEITGELRWTPPEKGEYEVTVVAEDEGHPPKRQETKLKIVVTDPPPDEPGSTFDVARFTFVTAIVAVDGQPQVWLHNRPEDRLWKLREGEECELGGRRVRIEKIEGDSVEIRDGERVYRRRPGEPLKQPD